ncbi:uncharacterized protein Dyak_GE28578, isoform E [Drosophila yakuba]|uniref:Uncharacterized protein, isoform E n=1 Tax=Drosophila yakuba TaxID=7245 RepID=A0A0R1E018_DROYA|nr:uncharacterized protein Dyak_GE28578, isoform E [Drosophila yakuba]
MNPQLKPDSSLLSSCIGKSIKIKKKEKFGAFSIDSILSTAEADLTLNSLSIDNANAISNTYKCFYTFRSVKPNSAGKRREHSGRTRIF